MHGYFLDFKSLQSPDHLRSVYQCLREKRVSLLAIVCTCSHTLANTHAHAAFTNDILRHLHVDPHYVEIYQRLPTTLVPDKFLLYNDLVYCDKIPLFTLRTSLFAEHHD